MAERDLVGYPEAPMLAVTGKLGLGGAVSAEIAQRHFVALAP
jgi:hypothetical protein